MTDHIFKLSLKNSVEWYITLLYYIQVEWTGVEWTPVCINICTWLYFVKSPVESSGVHMDSGGDSKVLCCNTPPDHRNGPSLWAERDVASLCLQEERVSGKGLLHRWCNTPWFRSEKCCITRTVACRRNRLARSVCCIVDATHHGFEVRDVASQWHVEGRGWQECACCINDATH